MKIVLIGSGNVASHLAEALLAANHNIIQVWSKHFENAVLLSSTINSQAVKYLSEIDVDADLYVLAIKDDAIEDVALQLKNVRGMIAHTSGAVPLHIFEGNFERYGVFYPLQTFSKAKKVNFLDIPLCLEANDIAGMQLLKNIARGISNTVVEINTEKRAILHLSAVFACNFVNHFYALADEILRENELNFNLIKPLIKETAEKIQTAKPISVQTGPAIRHDEKTIAKHESLLGKHPQLVEIYKMVSDSIKKTR